MNSIRPSIAAIALGLVLALLGHDALMTTDPHASADPNHTHHGVEQAVPETDHAPDTDCGLTTGARSQPTSLPDFDTPGAALIAPLDVDAAVGFTPCWSVAPDHPPDTRRALLQVFLN